METKLAVPIAATNPDQAIRQIQSARTAGADIIELRIDYLENLTAELVERLIAEVKKGGEKPLPVIVTCRDKREGGIIDYPQAFRVDMLIAALKAGAEFIDVEYENFRSTDVRERIQRTLSQYPIARLILSTHNFETKFDNIVKLYHNITNICPEAIPKLVYTANHINDCFEAFDLLDQAESECIALCMGEAGLISRILAKKLGSFLTFASIDEHKATAPGQLTVEQFRKLYRCDDINADTELFGVIADPVDHSLSPAIHNACFAEKGMNRLYLPLLVKGGSLEFDTFIINARLRPWLHFHGFSVTIPHKHSALKYVETNQGVIEPLAQKIGAANTLLIGPNEKLAAYNTDYAGALDAITAGMGITRADLKALPIAVVGAGGVSRAIVAGLSDAGAIIKIYNRTVEKAKKLATEFNCTFSPLEDLRKMDARIIVNCTSIGMHPKVDATPVPKEALNSDMAVFDTVYNPARTLLLREAREKGAKTIDGIAMFVNQAMAQFKLFTGTGGNPDLMKHVVLERLSS
ncbi:MAG: shikimate dehydrogenase [Sedimentisphaerales bacterium]|nr:shikimate dehydrogenase [Sedimentisphaerales bacterium]